MDDIVSSILTSEDDVVLDHIRQELSSNSNAFESLQSTDIMWLFFVCISHLKLQSFEYLYDLYVPSKIDLNDPQYTTITLNQINTPLTNHNIKKHPLIKRLDYKLLSHCLIDAIFTEQRYLIDRQANIWFDYKLDIKKLIHSIDLYKRIFITQYPQYQYLATFCRVSPLEYAIINLEQWNAYKYQYYGSLHNTFCGLYSSIVDKHNLHDSNDTVPHLRGGLFDWLLGKLFDQHATNSMQINAIDDGDDSNSKNILSKSKQLSKNVKVMSIQDMQAYRYACGYKLCVSVHCFT